MSMISPPDSNNFRCALTAAVIRALGRKRPRKPVSYRVVQAAMYRLSRRIQGVPFWFRVQAGHPHCDELASSIDALYNDRMIRDEGKPGQRDLHITVRGKQLIEKYRDRLEPFEPEIEKAVSEIPREITDPDATAKKTGSASKPRPAPRGRGFRNRTLKATPSKRN